MRGMLIACGLALGLAGAGVAQVIDLPRAMGAPEGVIIDSPMPAPVMQPGLLVMAEEAPDTAVVRLIPINYLNVEALCAALGGASIDLRPLYAGYGRIDRQTGPARGGAVGAFDRGAPLASFVPPGVRHIVGLRF